VRVPLTVKEDSHLQDSPSPLATPFPTTSLASLRSGVLSARSSTAACDGVLTGFVPFASASARLGCAEVWGSGPSLWLPVAQALGFTVKLAVYPDGAWWDCMASFYSTTHFLRQLPRTRDRDASPQLVFTDQASLPASSHFFWSSQHIPLLISPCDSPWCVPAGWHIFQRTFKHQVVDGATDAVHTVALMLPRDDLHCSI
jgi:hypothetical protein